ncbi:UDP-N-acetylmuramate dehydrogenase [Thermophagus sp. OGC60D27]|uniref:UDP-N-acetylmuramate dehydrogenase n=1 Tax=Thermophagus sp. OGC60D27 TaxID=3458415 RepID=UPI0040376B7C
MEYYNHYPLQDYTTFGVVAYTRKFYRFDTQKELKQWLEKESDKHPKKLVLGGGSNLLFTGDFDGTVLFPAFKGIELLEDNKDTVLVDISAGENWDDCVAWCVERGLGGIENLSYIPGNAGAAAVQNIGAYGVELADVVDRVEGFLLDSGEVFSMDVNECMYDYRYSIFKGPLQNNVVITNLVLRLSKKPKYLLDYGQVKEAVEKRGPANLKNIRNAIIDIRKSKLPDPNELGNGGSFFKNPIVEKPLFETLKQNYPDAVGYPHAQNRFKVAAGWLIEKAGWKGKCIGNAGVHDKQALVLINKGGATGKEIADLACEIQSDVLEKFGIKLDPEVNIL